MAVVYYGEREFESSIRHSGDNLTGEGSGDDERIMVNLHKMNPRVTDIFFCVCVFTSGKTFARVKNAYCRMLNVQADMFEMCRFKLDDGMDCQAVIMARVSRVGPAWRLLAFGAEATGQTINDQSLKEDLRLIMDPSFAAQRAARRAAEQEERRKQHEGTLHIVIVRAQDLAAKDRGGTSDPFAKLYFRGHKKGKTHVVKKELNPTWNTDINVRLHMYEVEDTSAQHCLEFTVWDKDRLSRNDFLGKVDVPLQQLIPDSKTACRAERWLPLQPDPRKPKEKVSGQMLLTWDWDPAR